jgi:hypothetical protein
MCSGAFRPAWSAWDRGPAPSPIAERRTPEWSAELIRVDGDRRSRMCWAPHPHWAGRRLRTADRLLSVSRHHALVLVGPREAIIEDLNSTNGVIVNGRKVSAPAACATATP